MKLSKRSPYRAGISALLITSMFLQPLVGLADVGGAAAVPQGSQHSLQIASIMLEDMAISAGAILQKIDTTTLNTIDAEKSAIAQKQVTDQIEMTKKSDADLESVRDSARSAAVKEAKRSKDDLITRIAGSSSETLDKYGEALKANASYADYAQQYAAAYTRTEKAQVLVAVVSQDIDQVLAVSLKRLNWLTADGIRADLQDLNNRVFEGKADGKNIKRILLIAGASVAFIGLATWGIATLSYNNSYNQQQGELETAYQARKTQLDNQFAQLKATLDGQQTQLGAAQAAELNALNAKLSSDYSALSAKLSADQTKYLNDNGYVWMTCDTYSQASSMICNNYNYQVFTGTSTCTVMCYKNVMLNRETLQAAPVCTSAYIPADCYSQAKYDAEYNAAYGSSYNAQHPIGEADGGAAGTVDGNNVGQANGTTDGNKDGNHAGYQDGYNNQYNGAYQTGYNDRYNTGYEDGYNAGYTAAYNDGYSKGYKDGYDSTYVPPSTGGSSGSGTNGSGTNGSGSGTGSNGSSSGTNGSGNGSSSNGSSSGTNGSGSGSGSNGSSGILMFNDVTPTAPNSTPAVKPQFGQGFTDGYRDAMLMMSLSASN